MKSTRVALVAASSQGLGYAVAEALARRGMTLGLTARTPERLEQAAQRLRTQYGVEVWAHPFDLDTPEGAEGFVRAALKDLGRVDVLVTNNGGPPPGTFEALTDEDWTRAFQRTLMSAVRMMRAVLPFMKSAGYGRIVHITSVSVREPIPGLLLSGVFRAGIVNLTRAVAREVAADGITVNVVAPGYMNTERLQEVLPDEAARGQILQEIPAKRIADPKELGAVVAFLASEEAAYLTGAVIPVDGGLFRGIW